MPKKKSNSGLGSLLTLVAAGAGLMYLYDPQRGDERRKVLRDKVSGLQQNAVRLIDNREEVLTYVQDAAVGASKMLKRESIDDTTLAQRVKDHLSRHKVTNPSAIEVNVSEGVVSLYGQVFADEVQRIIRALSTLYGVKRIDNQLAVYDRPENISEQ